MTQERYFQKSSTKTHTQAIPFEPEVSRAKPSQNAHTSSSHVLVLITL
jgi:hypothetical protein